MTLQLRELTAEEALISDAGCDIADECLLLLASYGVKDRALSVKVIGLALSVIAESTATDDNICQMIRDIAKEAKAGGKIMEKAIKRSAAFEAKMGLPRDW